MNQILVLIAIVGIGYLLYRSLVIKRQTADDESEQTTSSKPSSPAPTEPPAEPAAKSPVEPPAPPGKTKAVAAAGDTQPADAPVADDVGRDAEREAQVAQAKAAEKAHMQNAEAATKSNLQAQASAGLESNPAPPVPTDIETQVAALSETNEPLARHRLYQQIIETSYRLRADDAYRTALNHYAEAHIAEFDQIAGPLKAQNGGKLPQVATFKHYAALLTEAGQYEEAIKVCEHALQYDLKDGTKTGYQGRIERIKKLQAKS